MQDHLVLPPLIRAVPGRRKWQPPCAADCAVDCCDWHIRCLIAAIPSASCASSATSMPSRAGTPTSSVQSAMPPSTPVYTGPSSAIHLSNVLSTSSTLNTTPSKRPSSNAQLNSSPITTSPSSFKTSPLSVHPQSHRRSDPSQEGLKIKSDE